MARLVTLVEPDETWKDGICVQLRLDLELSSGRRVLLLDDRGWSSTGTWSETTAEDVRETSLVVVGPDEPPPGFTYEDEAAAYWLQLHQAAGGEGVEISADELRRLRHDVVLSPRLTALLGR